MKRFISVLFFTIFFFFSSCSDLQEVTFNGIEKIKLIKLSQQGVEAEITARIKNPNKTTFTIYKCDMDVTLGGLKAGKAHLEKNVRINANSENPYTFTIQSDFSGLSMKDIPKVIAMAMSRSVKVQLIGNIKAGKFFVKRNIPVIVEKDVPLNMK
jgi:LEA14-like dessication related protein